MKRLLLVVVAATLATPLMGFKFIDPPRKFRESEMPVDWVIGDQGPDGLSAETAQELTTAAFAQWENVPCSPLDMDFDQYAANQPTFGRSDRTQAMHIRSDSTADVQSILDSGINAAAVTHGDFNTPLPYNGTTFFRTTAANVIFNVRNWGDPQDVRDPQCFSHFSYLSTSTHEFGHGFGMGHSCDNGEPCPDPILRNATMYWSGGACDPSREDINADDAAGANAIYGIAVDFDIAPVDGVENVGGIPFTVEVTVPDEYQTPRYETYVWNFGDGSDPVTASNDGDVEPVEHTYTTEGQFTITLTAEGSDADCGGDFATDRRQVGAVLACDTPAPSFDYVNLGDNVVRMVNTSPLGAFGCVTDFEWTANGQTVRGYEPEFTFDSPGSYDVVLVASGHGGEGQATGSIDVTRAATGEGCSASVAGRGSSLALLLGLLGLAIRRR